MTKIDFLKNCKSKLMATITAATMMASASSVTASAQNITAQELMDQLIDGKQVTLDSDMLISYLEPIKQAIILNGANLIGPEAEKTYNNLINNTSKDRKTDLINLTEFVGYLLEANICNTFPQSLQIEQVSNYTCSELKKMEITTVDSNVIEGSEISLDVIKKMAKQKRELMESSYVIIYNTDIGTYDEDCFDINPNTGLENVSELSLLGASLATMALTRPKKKIKKK